MAPYNLTNFIYLRILKRIQISAQLSLSKYYEIRIKREKKTRCHLTVGTLARFTDEFSVLPLEHLPVLHSVGDGRVPLLLVAYTGRLGSLLLFRLLQYLL